MPPHIARGVSPHPSDAGTIPDIRSRLVRRPDRGPIQKELFDRRLRILFRTIKRGFNLEDLLCFELEGDGWRIAIKTDDHGDQSLSCRLENKPGQTPATISGTYSIGHASERYLTYIGSDGIRLENDNAIIPTITAIRPHFRRNAGSSSTSESGAGR